MKGENWMKELLLNKKKQFAIYIIACFLPVVDSLIRMGLFGMMFEVLDKKDIILFKDTKHRYDKVLKVNHQQVVSM